MLITQRDIELMMVINKFHFTVLPVMAYFASFKSKRNLQQRLQVLIKDGYIKRIDVVIPEVPEHTVYGLTPKGEEFVGREAISHSRPFSVYSWAHRVAIQKALVDYSGRIGVPLGHMLIDTDITGAKAIGVKAEKRAVMRNKHIPDAIFWTSKWLYFLEVELTMKTIGKTKDNILANRLMLSSVANVVDSKIKQGQLWVPKYAERKIGQRISNIVEQNKIEALVESYQQIEKDVADLNVGDHFYRDSSHSKAERMPGGKPLLMDNHWHEINWYPIVRLFIEPKSELTATKEYYV